MLGRAPKAEPVLEAMAETLNPNGVPYSGAGLSFPPGEWIEVNARIAERLTLLSWATVRQRPETD